jgi:hypothetical protein
VKHSAPDFDAVDRASEHDRLWFEKHPGAMKRTRPLIPGEFEDSKAGRGMVNVRCVRPGVRVRRFGGRGFMLDVDADADRYLRAAEDLFGRPS